MTGRAVAAVIPTTVKVRSGNAIAGQRYEILVAKPPAPALSRASLDYNARQMLDYRTPARVRRLAIAHHDGRRDRSTLRDFYGESEGRST